MQVTSDLWEVKKEEDCGEGVLVETHKMFNSLDNSLTLLVWVTWKFSESSSKCSHKVYQQKYNWVKCYFLKSLQSFHVLQNKKMMIYAKPACATCISKIKDYSNHYLPLHPLYLLELLLNFQSSFYHHHLPHYNPSVLVFGEGKQSYLLLIKIHNTFFFFLKSCYM